ncbi:uncharacterized protein LAJ45_01456 [Morchella importuna]|uniref:uncharacterized protein n=1 Tax=Morchella importuna TaxID=1174673 RepID=UPI001E8E7B37|nr:uncharacterized protein LAJ45_01456 [Morchella importuna]KAH8154924.1 hypothetical protein LAJ45_01456 [Morchella importuna]
MIDIELSSLPEAIPTQNIPYSQGYFRRFKQGAASLVGEMGRFIPSYLRENGSESSLSPVIISPWERLIDYSSVGYYYTAVSTSMPTTKGLLSYEGAFISNLSEFIPSLNKYWPTQVLICEYYSRIYINLRGRLPSFLISVPATVCPIPHHPCPAVTPLPSIPTIVVTDVDGSRAGCYNAMHETQRILGEGNPFLWREWKGKFSPVRVPENVFYDGAPPMSEDEEDEARVGAKCSQQGTNYQSEESSQGNVPRELEWWEKEDSEEESEEEDSEDDGDDEYEDDSDDDSDVDSDAEEDLDEASADHVRSITSSVSAVKTTVPFLCEPNAQHPIPIQSQTTTPGSCQLPQGLQEANDLGISLSSSSSSTSCFSLDDSDLESSNSSTTVSSVPTPITPTSPSITTIDSSDLQKQQQRDCNELPETSWLLMNSLDTALGAAQEAEMEMEFQISLQQGVRAGGCI